MAAVSLQTKTADVAVFPFTGLTAVQRSQSGIARAQISLVWEQTSLSATTSGDIKAMRFFGQLPRNFAYVYMGGSIKIGSADTTNVLDQSRGCFFENEIQCSIVGTDFSDNWKMLNEGVQKIENDVQRSETSAFRTLADQSAFTTTHFATPGVLNGAQGFYQKIYKDINYPRVIYRAENADIPVTADAINVVQDPFPGSQYVALGEMHFLQYDIDQAYNYLIHSPVPVR